MKILIAILILMITFSAQASEVGRIVYTGCFGGNRISSQDIISLISYTIGAGLIFKIILISIEKYNQNKKLNNEKEEI